MEERLLKYFRDHEAEIFGDLERLGKAGVRVGGDRVLYERGISAF